MDIVISINRRRINTFDIIGLLPILKNIPAKPKTGILKE
jgi:hypothetical protein